MPMLEMGEVIWLHCSKHMFDQAAISRGILRLCSSEGRF
jgi:hypothetical protein